MRQRFRFPKGCRPVPLVLAILLASCGGGSDGGSTFLIDPGTGGPGSGTGALTSQFGGDRDDGAVATAVDSNGNVYVAGITFGTVDPASPNPDSSSGTSDFFVAKYNRSGTRLWIRQVGTRFPDFPTGIALEGGDNVVVSGYTFGDLFSPNKDPSHFTSDFFLMKFTGSGDNTAYRIQDGTADNDEAWGVTSDDSGNLYVTGGTRGNQLGTVVFGNAGDFDSFAASYDGGGLLRWARRAGVNLENRDFGRNLVADKTRNILYVIGEFYLSTWSPAIFVERMDPATGISVPWNPSNGDLFVFGRVEGNALQQDFATGIAVDREGSVYVSGYEIAWNDNTFTSNAGDSFYVLFKLDPSGNLLWHTYVQGGPADSGGNNPGTQGRGLIIDDMLDVYLAGYTSTALDNSVRIGETDAFLIQFDGRTGAIEWTRQFGTPAYDRGFAVALDWNRQDPVIWVAGETDGSFDGLPSPGDYDAFLAAFDRRGNAK